MTGPLDLYSFDVYALSASTQYRGGTIAVYGVQAPDRDCARYEAKWREERGAAPHALIRLPALPARLGRRARRYG